MVFMTHRWTTLFLLLSLLDSSNSQTPPPSQTFYNGNNVYSVATNPYLRIKWPAKDLPSTSNRVETQILNLSPKLLGMAGAVQVCVQNYLTDLPDNAPHLIQPVLRQTLGSESSCIPLTMEHVDKHSQYNVENYLSAVSYTHMDVENEKGDVNVTVVASLRIFDTVMSQSEVTFEYTKDRNKMIDNVVVWEQTEGTLAVEKAFGLGYVEESKIDPGVLEVEGMSGKKFRHFLNNLVRLRGGRNYLEIGVWAGSSFTSAISNNENLVNAIAIDNFSEYEHASSEASEWRGILARRRS